MLTLAIEDFFTFFRILAQCAHQNDGEINWTTVITTGDSANFNFQFSSHVVYKMYILQSIPKKMFTFFQNHKTKPVCLVFQIFAYILTSYYVWLYADAAEQFLDLVWTHTLVGAFYTIHFTIF